jgi:S1-C subfamily serine protease
VRDERLSVAAATCRVNAGKSFGSGVAVAWGSQVLVVTCKHVVDGADLVVLKVVAETDDGYQVLEVPAEVVRVNKKHDLALLRPQVADGLSPLALATSEPGRQDMLMVAGCVNGAQGVCVDAILQARDGSDDDAENPSHDYLISGLFSAGVSGGAVANQDGELVGIAKEVVRNGDRHVHLLGYATPLPALRRFLQQAVKRHLALVKDAVSDGQNKATDKDKGGIP